jgi:hypothetical protein
VSLECFVEEVGVDHADRVQAVGLVTLGRWRVRTSTHVTEMPATPSPRQSIDHGRDDVLSALLLLVI